jgi:serine/threonine protein kinase
VVERVREASRPEHVFKPLTVLIPPRLLAEHLKPEMDQMMQVLDAPYSMPDDAEAARGARQKLLALYERALRYAARGTYAPDDFSVIFPTKGSTIEVNGVRYVVQEKCHIGEKSTMFRGAVEIDGGSMGVRMRVAHTSDDNHALLNEIRMLDMLHRHDVGYWKNIPFMLDRFMAGDRIGVITRHFDGLTLTELRTYALHRAGLDQRHVVWVMDRMLGLMWYYHELGIVHGRITPEKVRIRPSNHNAMLTGWGGAVFRPAITGERVSVTNDVFQAPEVGVGGSIGPWTDIYSLGKTLIWLLGGDPKTNEMPDTVEVKIRQFLLNMVWKSPKARPHDARQLYTAQNRLKDSLWERRFIHLNLA